MGKKIGLRGRSRTGKGVLEIGPHFGPPPAPLAAPWEPNLAPWEPFCEQFAHTSLCKLCSQPAQPSGGTIHVLVLKNQRAPVKSNVPMGISDLAGAASLWISATLPGLAGWLAGWLGWAGLVRVKNLKY